MYGKYYAKTKKPYELAIVQANSQPDAEYDFSSSITGVLCVMTILPAGARTPIELTEQSGINYQHNTDLG
jgi:hypothetical protein